MVSFKTLNVLVFYALAIAFCGQLASCGFFDRFRPRKRSSNATVSQPPSPVIQSGLVFESATWDDSQLASTVLFLEEFCRDVNAKKFKEQVSDAKAEELFGNCIYVFSYLLPLASHLPTNSALGNPYENALKPEKFEDYVDWLKKNIPKIWKSYISMFKESAELTEEQIQTDSSVGPLKYGFVFVGGGWRSFALNEFGPATMGVMAELKRLHNCLDKIL
ncbi:secreted antigen 1 [Babesia divergens]|uniref:Secreted antigen 1 n=1 Tax=Babesia divergens TaxID=32595 RepID=A0AAD9GH65_BABDI|nr:secreted antigen 1 [Babesia divergens]